MLALINTGLAQPKGRSRLACDSRGMAKKQQGREDGRGEETGSEGAGGKGSSQEPQSGQEDHVVVSARSVSSVSGHRVHQ
jgi:hypothetical protein